MTLLSLCRRAGLFVFLIATFAFLSLARAQARDTKPFLHPLFTNNMVLQRGIADPVWGWCAPGRTVSVSINGKTAKAIAGADGKWMAHVGPLAPGGPYTLTVSGPQTVTLRNVLVGDVWICSGQSNMEFGIGNTLGGAQEIAHASHPNIRLFLVTKTAADSPRDTVPVNASDGHWQVCTPKTVAMGGWNGFSAVGYFFARDLQQSVHVPIGLIESDWGGTIAEAWTSARALSAMPDFQPAVASLQKLAAAAQNGGTYARALAAWYARHDPGSIGNAWAAPALDTSAWKTMALPQFFQDAGDPDVANTNGVVWFRRTFDLPAGDAGKSAVLHLMADDSDTTWVNGTQIGATDGFNTPRAYPIAAGLLKPAGNVVAVRVLDTGGKGGIYGDAAGLSLDVPGGTPLPLAGPWAYKLGTGLPKDDSLPAAPGSNPNIVTVLYNGMIAPLVPFGIKGALWYQGEANAGRAKQYQTLLPTLIKDWRTRFGVGSFPFLIVQLAGWQPGGDQWPELQEAQMMTATHVPNAGIATAVDIGDRNDIHPKNKQEVGRRLALVAEAKVYGGKNEYSGPVYRSMTVQGGAIRLMFTHLGGGLAARNGGPLSGFAIAGKDGSFAPADARIEGSTVVVSSPQVPAPTAVRYAWASYPETSLYNNAGLPAFPFRTDVPVPIPDPVLPQRAGADLALGKIYVCSDPNLYNYGIGGLTDGSWDVSTPHCFASGDKDAFPKTATIDLQQAARVGLVTVGVPPFGSTKTVEVSVSADGNTFTPVGRCVFSLRKEEKHLFSFPPTLAQFVRLTYPDHYDTAVGYTNTFVFTTECRVYAPRS